MDAAAPLDSAAAPDAPGSLVEHAKFVRRVAFAVLRDDDDADDAAQDALARGLESGPRDPAARRSWLATVVRNMARRLRRTRSRAVAREHAAARPEPTMSAADAAARSETIRRVGEAVAALAEPGRTAVLLRHYDGLAPREIAARLDVPVETVKSRLKRAHEDLRARLDSTARPDSTPWRVVLAAFAGLGVESALAPPAASAAAGGGSALATAAKIGAGIAAVGAIAIGVGALGSTPSKSSSVSPRTEPSVAPVVPPTPVPSPSAPLPPERTAAPLPAVVPAPVPTTLPDSAPLVSPTPAAPSSRSPTPLASEPSDRPTAAGMASGPALAGADAPRPPPGPTPPAPSGMVWVDVTAARPRIGTSAEEAFRLGEKRSADVQVTVAYEVPAHDVSLRPFFLDEFEVTNAQYLRFLDATKKTTYTTGTAGALVTLEEIASYLAYGTAKGAEQAKDATTWAQLYELNKKTLTDAMPGVGKDALRRAVLPPDLTLRGYRWRLPRHWFIDSDRLEGDTAPNHPVRDVSYLEAEAFAEWAGKHIPTEDEFEWAARGPRASQFPWGDDWVDDVKAGRRAVETRCNWLDLGKKSARTMEPTTVAVDEMPEGRSWCGAYHLVGNVSEWTSSWFDPYPGWPGGDTRWSPYYDHYVRVIRGGSCADRERIALRAAHRNFIGVERLQPPLPANHFDYTGFRCALYLTPSLDRLEPAIARLLRPKKIRREQVAIDRFAGAAVVHFAPQGATPENHVHVTAGSAAVLLAPLSSIFGLAGDDKDKARDLERPKARTPDELLALAPGPDEDVVPIGVLHTDVDLAKVRLLDVDAATPKPHAQPRRGSKAAVPATREGDLPRGTYVLGLSNGFVGVYRSNFDFVAFLGRPSIVAAKVKPGEAPPASMLEVDPDADLVKAQFWIAIGGKGVEPGDGVLIRFVANTVPGQLEKARGDSSWR